MGWLGFIVILFSYAQVALQRWRVRSLSNQLGNFAGSLCLMINSFFYQAWVPLILNIAWAFIAIHCLLQVTKNKNQSMIKQEKSL